MYQLPKIYWMWMPLFIYIPNMLIVQVGVAVQPGKNMRK